MVIGSVCTRVTKEEKEARDALFIVPENERDPDKMRKTLRVVKGLIVIGALVTILLLIFWAIPYLCNV